MLDTDHDPNQIRIINPTYIVPDKKEPREIVAYCFQLPPDEEGKPSQFVHVSRAGTKVEVIKIAPQGAVPQKQGAIYKKWDSIDSLAQSLIKIGLMLAPITDGKDGISSYNIRYQPKLSETYQRACVCEFDKLKEPILHWESVNQQWVLRLADKTESKIQFCPICGQRLLNPEVEVNA